MDHAKWMKTQLQNEETPLLADEVESQQFPQHFADLMQRLTGWRDGIYLMQRNPNLRPSPGQRMANQSLRSVIKGNVGGTCKRCDDIAADFSRVDLRSLRLTNGGQSPHEPSQESEGKE